MRAEFEEKTYEQQLTLALVHGKRLFFPPGQVLEDIVGFDVALLTSNHEFWKNFPHLYRWWHRYLFMHPPGMTLGNEWWEKLEREIEYFPRFKFNCFVQAKRPDRMVRSDAAEYSHWRRPYFRYNTFPNQHSALESLANATARRAIVVYACPAFHTYAELWNAVNSGQLVQKSNFCEVAKLSGYSRFSFISPGNAGCAHSEPEPVESVPFEQALEQMHEQEPSSNNLSFLQKTAEEIDDAATKLGDLQKTYRSMVASLFPNERSKLARPLAQIFAFQFICNVQLLIGYEL